LQSTELQPGAAAGQDLANAELILAFLSEIRQRVQIMIPA